MKKLFLIYSFLLFTLYSSHSIVYGANISGKILDDNSAAISFANITIQELSTSAISDQNGSFIFSQVPQGVYHLSVIRTGYLNKTIPVSVGSSDLSVDIILEKSLIETQTIDVTSTFNPTDISNSTYSVTSVGPRTLSKIRSANIASTIQNIAGINNLSTGSSIGKPVIRGLTSQSVLIVHDGIKHESQLWGDEHGPEVPVFEIDRIEILRGPASLIYGADGIGGVVNIITKPLQFSNKNKVITYGALDLNGFSMNTERAGNITLGLGTNNFGIKAFGGYRKSNEINTPEGEFTINIPDGQRIIQGGKLFNSRDKEFQSGATLGFKGIYGNISAAYENFNREIQIHEDPLEDPEASPNQKIITNHFELKGNFYLKKDLQLEPVLSYEHQDRKEFESEEAKKNDIEALNLVLRVAQGDLRLHHNLSKNISGTFGVSVVLNDNKSLAEEKLIPNYNATGYGIYILEKLEKKYFTISGGIRYDLKNLRIKETVFETNENGIPTKTIAPQNFDFNSTTGSIGFVYKPLENLDIFANAGRGWRPTSEFELFVDGVHEGTGRFEKGLIILDPSYEPHPEESLNLDAGARIRSKIFTGEVSLFRNLINNFIYPSPTGQVDSASGLPIFDIKQDKSIFLGFEYSFQFQPISWILMSIKGDYVNTKNKATNEPLPYTPPSKNIIDVKLQKDNLGKLYNPYFSIGAKIVAAANKIDPLESVTEGYTIFNAGLGFDFVLSKSIASIDFNVTNLTGKKYTDHLSRYKYYALNPGRSFNLKISVPFQF